MSLNAALAEPMSASKVERVSDLPILVIGRLGAEWARADQKCPMRLWGYEYLGTHVTDGLDRWYIGRDDKSQECVFYITRENEALGRKLGQDTWRVRANDLARDQANARLEPV